MYLQQENGLLPFLFLPNDQKTKMLISYFGDLKYKSFNQEYITHKSSHQKYNCPKKITDHTLGWAFDNIFFSFSNENGRCDVNLKTFLLKGCFC